MHANITLQRSVGKTLAKTTLHSWGESAGFAFRRLWPPERRETGYWRRERERATSGNPGRATRRPATWIARRAGRVSRSRDERKPGSRDAPASALIMRRAGPGS